MKINKAVIIPEPVGFDPLTFDAAVCNGCNLCIDVCQVDILIPNPEKGKPPLMPYPGECWYEGSCVDVCPRPGAVKLNIPLMNRVNWKKK